jgi:hypothetical protein
MGLLVAVVVVLMEVFIDYRKDLEVGEPPALLHSLSILIVKA